MSEYLKNDHHHLPMIATPPTVSKIKPAERISDGGRQTSKRSMRVILVTTSRRHAGTGILRPAASRKTALATYNRPELLRMFIGSKAKYQQRRKELTQLLGQRLNTLCKCPNWEMSQCNNRAEVRTPLRAGVYCLVVQELINVNCHR